MPDPGDGSQTFYYTNQQSARLLFYHDHSYGITRLNVYAGEAAAYVIRDDAEQQLIDDGLIPSGADEIPLIVQDKTFVDPATVYETDPTWNWGTTPGTAVEGDLWWPHVYMTAQNPYDLTGTNAYGRWHYGPWFWPPTTNIVHGPVPNEYYDPINAPWEPPMRPGTPNNSMGMEAFHDTALVNGAVYPVLNVDPKAYRFRVLNASNDRFFNLQTYVADPTTTSPDARSNGLTEVPMVPASVCATFFPEGWPTDGRVGGVPDPRAMGPDWIQIGTEAGFLPAPAVVPNQPIAWNNNPTTFNFGNVNAHSLLMAPAERTDVVVDFSQYRGKTLILYNDAPAAFPALDPRYDYYTGAPDLTAEGGHSGPQVGYGPNTRTIMQINVADIEPEPEYDLMALQDAFKSTDTAEGVFESSQDPIIVGQTAYDSAYNTTFPTTWPTWGASRIQDNEMSFETLSGDVETLYMEPKAIQDEMGEAFDREFGRMASNLGLSMPFSNATNANFILYGFIDPPTENVSASITPLGETLADGTQLWKITHNGVDTHPIHFHLFDVQLINRVGWDGAIRMPDANELGWKDTIRVSPLEDTIVAIRPITPEQPFGIPDSVRLLNPAAAEGSTMGFSNIDPLTGQRYPTPVTNEYYNFGWEYVWHCHILSHEEMDMMRPITFDAPRALAQASVLGGAGTPGSAINLTWTDPTPADAPSTMGNPANEVGWRVERAVVSLSGTVGPFSVIASPLANQTAYTDSSTTANTTYQYRIVAWNAAGDTVSNTVTVGPPTPPPAAPTSLSTSRQTGPTVRLSWQDNATNETSFVIERQTNGGAWVEIATRPALAGTGTVTYTDSAVVVGASYAYRVKAVNAGGSSAWSNTSTISLAYLPTAPDRATARSLTTAILVGWRDRSDNEDGFQIWRSTNATTGFVQVGTAARNAISYSDRNGIQNGTTYFYKVRAYNGVGVSGFSNTISTQYTGTTQAAGAQRRAR